MGLNLSIIKDTNSLIAFFGFILVIGTILGIIIDYIHHWLIEGLIFDKFDDIQLWIIRTNKFTNRMINSYNQLDYCENANTILYYFVAEIGSNAIEYYLHLRKSKYCYSEFYSNIFLSLILFSLVAPFYLIKTFQISWSLCISISFISIFLSCISILSSYQTYLYYNKSLYYLIRGYMEKNRPRGSPVW
jgi:hypothetical protein